MSLQKNIKLLTWFNFLTDFKLYSAFIIVYFVKVTHSYALGASILSITFITTALLDVPMGIFADRIGRKRTVICGALSGVTYSLLYAISGNYWILVLAAFIEGLSRALYSGNNSALLHNMLSDENMEHEYHVYSGKLGAMLQIGLGASSIVGGFIANWSFPLVIWLSVIPQIICVIISFQIVDSKRIYKVSDNILVSLKEGIFSFVHNANLRLLSLDSILGYSMGECFYQLQPGFFNALLPIWAVGIARSVSSIGAALGFHFSGKIVSKFNAFKVLLWGEIYAKIIDFAALLFPSVVSPFLLSATSFAYGTGSVASETLMQKEFTDKQRATMSSLNSFAGSMLYGIVTFLAGLLVDKIGIKNVLILIQVLMIPTIWFLFKLLKANRSKNV